MAVKPASVSDCLYQPRTVAAPSLVLKFNTPASSPAVCPEKPIWGFEPG